MNKPQCECATPVRYSGRMQGKDVFSIACPLCERITTVSVDFSGDKTVTVKFTSPNKAMRTISIAEEVS